MQAIQSASWYGDAGPRPSRLISSARYRIPRKLDADGVAVVVQQITGQFHFLIEKRRLSEELYHKGSHRPEKATQRLFFAVAHAYCKANNLDLAPEADTGNEPLDFKMSSGFAGRVLVEINFQQAEGRLRLQQAASDLQGC